MLPGNRWIVCNGRRTCCPTPSQRRVRWRRGMDKLLFHTVDELRGLSTDELRALWELVPTERQRSYRVAYEREMRNVGSDALEKHVNEELLRRYVETGLV